MCVQLLDLGCNRLATVHDVQAAIVLPSLQRLVLMGNPVAARSTVFTKAFNVGSSLQCIDAFAACYTGCTCTAGVYMPAVSLC